MSNFPVGSKIIITNAEEGESYKNGDIFTVIATNGVGVWVSCAVGSCYISSYEFEAYTEPFKVGDKVITTADNKAWGYKFGDRGTVDYIDSQEPKVRLKGAGYHFTEDLKLAPAKAEPTPTSHIKVLATKHPREYEVGDILEVHAEQSTVEGGIRVVNKHGYTSVVFKGQWEYVAAPVKAEPELKFKVGDAVVVQSNPEWAKEGQTGVIERVDLEEIQLPYDVKGDDGWNFWMREQDLELVPEEEPLAEWEKELLGVTPRSIAFEDIKKGDTIRAEYEKFGVKHTAEGIAHFSGGGVWSKYWAAEQGDYVANASWTDATYTLLERPEPPKPNPFAEAKVGSVAGEKDGYVWLKTANDTWQFFRQTEEHSLSGSSHTDHHMNNGRWTLLHTA